jgi:hypothetical protein
MIIVTIATIITIDIIITNDIIDYTGCKIHESRISDVANMQRVAFSQQTSVQTLFTVYTIWRVRKSVQVLMA